MVMEIYLSFKVTWEIYDSLLASIDTIRPRDGRIAEPVRRSQ